MIVEQCVNKYNDKKHSVTSFDPRYLLNEMDVSIIPEELKQDKLEIDWMRNKAVPLENTLNSQGYNKSFYNNCKNYNVYVSGMVYVQCRKNC